MAWLIAHKELLVQGLLGALLAVSEVLGSSEKFKNSSIFQLVVDVLKKLKAQ